MNLFRRLFPLRIAFSLTSFAFDSCLRAAGVGEFPDYIGSLGFLSVSPCSAPKVSAARPPKMSPDGILCRKLSVSEPEINSVPRSTRGLFFSPPLARAEGYQSPPPSIEEDSASCLEYLSLLVFFFLSIPLDPEPRYRASRCFSFF